MTLQAPHVEFLPDLASGPIVSLPLRGPVRIRGDDGQGVDRRLSLSSVSGMPRLRLEDFPDDDTDRTPKRPAPAPGTIAFRCLQARRIQPKLTTATVGRTAKLSAGHYYRIEEGTKIPTLLVVAKLAEAFRALGVDVTEEWIAFAKGRAPRKLHRPASSDALPPTPKAVSRLPGSAVQPAALLFPPVDRARLTRVLPPLRTVAAETGTTVARIALAWQLTRPFVTSIIGAKTREQLADNLAAVDVSLSPEQIRQLDEASALPPEYPGWMVEWQNRDMRGVVANTS